MEYELKRHDSNSKTQQLEPVDNGSAKNDRHFLKLVVSAPAPTTPPAVISQSIEVEPPEKKFDAFVRKDVYGIMGRGKLPLKEKILLGVALVTVVPIRLVLSVVVFGFYYLICWVCTLFSVPNGGDYTRIGGWRRVVIVQCGRFLSRVMLFVLGFYSIKETGPNPHIAERITIEEIWGIQLRVTR